MIRRALPPDRLPDGWRSPDRGLSSADAAARRARWGDNDIVEEPRGGLRALVLATLADPMLWFLAVTSAVYALVGQRFEAISLLAAMVPLIAMDAVLHRRTQASTQGLTSRLAHSARALRDGAAATVPAAALVPGDLVQVGAGEPFPADGVVLGGRDLQADESILTGEAFAAVKRPLDRDPGRVALDAIHWGFAGTRLLTGSATLRVVFTGAETLYGEIVRSAVAGTQALTPLQRAMGRLVSVLVVAATLLCLVIGWARLRQGHGWVDALVSAVTLASAALPEEFPVVFTFFLGLGVYRLAQRRALVRRAVSVENIGRVSCVCADKTGTITEGRLLLAHRLPAAEVTETRLLRIAALASSTDVGDPLDVAILDAAGAAADTDTVAVFPFTEARRWQTAVTRSDGTLVAVAKGAVETVLAACEPGLDSGPWLRRTAELGAEAHKVIACAWRPVDAERWRGEEVTAGYRFAGLLAFEDPVRPGVPDSVARCRAAGVRVIMVTGDHAATARAVAAEIGLGDGDLRLVAGDDVPELSGEAIRTLDVVARAAPAQKLALVQALQRAGHVVAVTGDGVNDVPALQAADVGVAMGGRGARSAREVASIVLLDDDFSTIARAIAEGRRLFGDLQRAFLYLLMVHVPLVLTAAFLPLAGYPLLYLPTHIVWLELVIHPTALLAFRQHTGGDEFPPRATAARFFSRRQWIAVVVVGAVLTAMVTTAWLRGLADQGEAHGRALALAVLTFGSAALTAALSRLRTGAARAVAAGTVLLTLVLVDLPVAAARLHLAPLHVDDWVLAAVAALVVGGLAVALTPPLRPR
jgi:Ca2+-transporting ATPase